MPRKTSATITTPKRFEGELVKIRRQGYAVNNGEMIESSRCVAAPILNSKGRPIAATSVSGRATRIVNQDIPKIGQSLLRCSAAISKQID